MSGISCRVRIISITWPPNGFPTATCTAISNPYDSPYEAFINYMNVLSDFKIEVDKKYGEAIRAVPA